jgi:hypothetical protein
VRNQYGCLRRRSVFVDGLVRFDGGFIDSRFIDDWLIDGGWDCGCLGGHRLIGLHLCRLVGRRLGRPVLTAPQEVSPTALLGGRLLGRRLLNG